MGSELKWSEEEFANWFELVKENAIADFGYSESETLSFSQKNWRHLYESGFTPFESVVQHLKKEFKHQNG